MNTNPLNIPHLVKNQIIKNRLVEVYVLLLAAAASQLIEGQESAADTEANQSTRRVDSNRRRGLVQNQEVTQ